MTPNWVWMYQVSSTSKSDMVMRTEVLNLNDTEGSLTWDEVSVLLQRMSSLFQYTPMLSVVPEVGCFHPYLLYVDDLMKPPLVFCNYRRCCVVWSTMFSLCWGANFI
jgi:hypothetical protein